jgi:hypothetical protein
MLSGTYGSWYDLLFRNPTYSGLTLYLAHVDNVLQCSVVTANRDFLNAYTSFGRSAGAFRIVSAVMYPTHGSALIGQVFSRDTSTRGLRAKLATGHMRIGPTCRLTR